MGAELEQAESWLAVCRRAEENAEHAITTAREFKAKWTRDREEAEAEVAAVRSAGEDPVDTGMPVEETSVAHPESRVQAEGFR